MNGKLEEDVGLTESPWRPVNIMAGGKYFYWEDSIVIDHGESTDIIVSIGEEVATELAMKVISDAGLIIDVEPKNGWVSRINGKFRWVLTPAANITGPFKIIIFSREVNWVLERDCWVALPEQRYNVFINGVLANPAVPTPGRYNYVKRDEVSIIKLVPVNLPELPVALRSFSFGNLKWTSDPLPDIKKMVGADGREWELSLSESDHAFQLNFSTVFPGKYWLYPGYHDEHTTLTSISKTEDYPGSWVLEVRAKRDGEGLPFVRLNWRYNNSSGVELISDSAGYGRLTANRPGVYSVKLDIKGQPHSVQTIKIN